MSASIEAAMAAAKARASWQFRMIEYTRGNQTPTGSIVIAMLGRVPNNLPMLNNTAVITEAGEVLCDYVSRHGVLHRRFHIGNVQRIVGDFNRLCDELKLNDAESIEVFETLRRWISIDERTRKTTVLQ